EAGLEGIVVIWLRISAEGAVLDAKVHRSSGHRVLDNAALRHARGLRFIPASQGGVAVEAEETQRYTFRLPYSHRPSPPQGDVKPRRERLQALEVDVRHPVGARREREAGVRLQGRAVEVIDVVTA